MKFTVPSRKTPADEVVPESAFPTGKAALALIAGSNCFDREWYLLCNSDIAQAQVDPVEHYLNCGWREGRNPSPDFDGNDYRDRYPDVASSGLNPLLHYEFCGKNEGRSRRPVEQTGNYPGRSHGGFCPVCEQRTVFLMRGSWLRDQYECTRCGSLPRHRAVIDALNGFCPDWRERTMHESSPGNVASDKLRNECGRYSSSQFFPELTPGKTKDGVRCENLEKLTFPDGSFELFVTLDVFEHILNPEAAFAEVARVLKPGGVHIFTTPWNPGMERNRRRVIRHNGKLLYPEPKVYHGNPVDGGGSLVVTDWGREMIGQIRKCGGMDTVIHLHRDPNLGLDGEYLHVFLSFK